MHIAEVEHQLEDSEVITLTVYYDIERGHCYGDRYTPDDPDEIIYRDICDEDGRSVINDPRFHDLDESQIWENH